MHDNKKMDCLETLEAPGFDIMVYWEWFDINYKVVVRLCYNSRVQPAIFEINDTYYNLRECAFVLYVV